MIFSTVFFKAAEFFFKMIFLLFLENGGENKFKFFSAVLGNSRKIFYWFWKNDKENIFNFHTVHTCAIVALKIEIWKLLQFWTSNIELRKDNDGSSLPFTVVDTGERHLVTNTHLTGSLYGVKPNKP